MRTFTNKAELGEPRRCVVCGTPLQKYGVQYGIEGWHPTLDAINSVDFLRCQKHGAEHLRGKGKAG